MFTVSHGAFDKNKNPMLLVDLCSKRVRKVNLALCDLFESSSEELLGTDIDALLLKHRGTIKWEGLDGECNPDTSAFDVTFENRPARVIIVNKTLLSPRHGTFVVNEHQTTLSKITTWKNKFEVLSGRLKQIQSLAKVGTWEYDTTTGMVSRCSTVADIVGSPERLCVPLEDVLSLYAPEYAVRHIEVWASCLNDGKDFDEVMELISAQGTRKWVRITGAAIRNCKTDEVSSVQGALQDVSEIISARQQTEAVSTMLEETLNGVSDTFMILNRQWQVTFANDSASRLMGVSKSEMLGENIWTLFPEAKGSEFHKRYEKLMATGETQRFVAKSPRSSKWLSISAYATSHGLAISSRDVTKEHHRDQQLRLLEAAVSRLNDIVMISQVDTSSDASWEKFVFANEAFERITGYTSDYAIGKTAEFLRGPDTQVEEIARMKAAAKNKQPYRTKIINYTKAGVPIWLDLDVLPIKKNDGLVTHWVSVARDVTDKIEGERRIRLSEERFRLVAEASNDVIWDCDLHSGKMWWNDKLLKVFGHDAEEFSNELNWWEANLHPEDQNVILERMRSIKESSAEFWELEYRFRKADGKYAHVIDRGSVQRDENGTATRILGNMTDITERLHLEELLRQSQKMEAIGKLTGGVAHDFNNLLAIIMGNLELLKEELRINGRPPKDAVELIDAGISAVKRGSGLTAHMLAYARKARLAPVDTDLNDVIRETESWVRRTIESNIEIITKLDRFLWTTCVDPISLQNAIVNLILNARDALEGGGKITIKTENIWPEDRRVDANGFRDPQNGFVMLSITDDGHGISSSDLEQVFDPFFTTKPVGKGSGLGLSMVQGFVSQSNGEIRMQSEPDIGTRLELYFKAESSEKQTPVDEKAQISEKFVRNEHGALHTRILLVEDERDVQRMLSRTLSNSGFDIVTADNGDIAANIFKTDSKFDLILTDISMPGSLDGFQLAQKCRSINSCIPVIFLSGHASENTDKHEKALPTSMRLTKPLSQRDLIAAVRKILQSEKTSDFRVSAVSSEAD